MSAARHRLVHHALTHASLVPAAAASQRRATAPAVWSVAAAVVGLAVGLLTPNWLERNAFEPERLAGPQPADVRAQALEQQLVQARAALQVAGARGNELERQVDAVNQQLRVSQEELAFFRKARPGVAAQR
ncbi:MAG: hypothetical protein ABI696_19130 [Rubrivivax sp.]